MESARQDREICTLLKDAERLARPSLDLTDFPKRANPYLDVFCQVHGVDATAYHVAVDDDPFDPWSFPAMALRTDLVCHFACAVPDEETLALIARHGPVVEVGCGTGYWARLLRDRGVDVVAYDRFPPNRTTNPCGFAHVWTEVRRGMSPVVADHADRTLLLCWPPYNEKMAANCLATYAGQHVVYVGEWRGCTADDAFHDALERDWDEVARSRLPRWEGIHDALWVYQRKGE